MLLRVTHETLYNYDPAVETAQHLVYLKPLETPSQRVHSHRLQITPEPTQTRQDQDVFGNHRCFFSLQTPHTVLKVVADSVVETSMQKPPASNISWEDTRELFCYRAGAQFNAASEFVFASPFVPIHPEFAAYAAPSFAPGTPVLAGAVDLMQRIHREFTYRSQSTQINTPALEALQQRTGVCQDFAHIMIACLRVMGIPARYVSGYLLTQPAPGTVKLKGSDASHAWVAVYVPDLPPHQRWFELDPTNNRSGWSAPGEDFAKLAIGRDFGDVSPMRGVIHGGSSHTLHVGVTVEQVDNQLTNLSQGQSQRQSQSQSQSQSQANAI